MPLHAEVTQSGPCMAREHESHWPRPHIKRCHAREWTLSHDGSLSMAPSDTAEHCPASPHAQERALRYPTVKTQSTRRSSIKCSAALDYALIPTNLMKILCC